MKRNIVIVGDNELINKNVGGELAINLELNFLDFDEYCEYINCVKREQVWKEFGKRKFNELQKEALPHMQDFCDSVIGFDGKCSRIPQVYKLLGDTAYIICIADTNKEKYQKYTDIWVNLGNKQIKNITNEIMKKLGEM